MWSFSDLPYLHLILSSQACVPELHPKPPNSTATLASIIICFPRKLCLLSTPILLRFVFPSLFYFRNFVTISSSLVDSFGSYSINILMVHFKHYLHDLFTSFLFLTSHAHSFLKFPLLLCACIYFTFSIGILHISSNANYFKLSI